MKVAWMILHYGRPYLKAAVAAIYPQVDKIVIAYTPEGSQNFKTGTPPPDTEAELQAEVVDYMDKIEWFSGIWGTEGEHCDAARAKALTYQPTWLVRFDSDEIVWPGLVDWWIEQANQSNHGSYRVPFMHFWRSMRRVCVENQMPDRLQRPGGVGETYLPDPHDLTKRVCHMGYAQPTKYIAYKLEVSGHKSEFKPHWFERVWLANAQTDCHPVINDFWTPEDFDKTLLPDVLKQHPYYDMEVIE